MNKQTITVTTPPITLPGQTFAWIALLALTIFLPFCKKEQPNLAKQFTPPAYEQPVAPQFQATTPIVPAITVKDSTLANGNHIVILSFTGQITVNVSGSGVPPKDTIVKPPIDTIKPTGDFYFVGSNTFPWVPLSKFSDIGIKTVRAYCPWHWVCTPNGLFIEPIYQAYTNEAPGIDTYLEKAKARGIDVLMCFNQCPEWLRPTGNGTGGNDYPPIKAGLNRTDPNSYKEYADFFFQVTARYGRVKHPDNVLRVDVTPQYANQPTNQKKSGLNLMRMVEVGNELDHWFSGFNSEKYMKAEEHAALLSTCYDAIKRADPSMLVVMAGLTDMNLAYLKAMNAWFIANRPDKKFAADIINIHHYSNILNRPGTDKPTWEWSGACYPEEDKAFSQINEIVTWSRALGKKCFVTEFGADDRPPSMMHVKGSKYGLTDQQAQAELIVRSYKAYKAAGVDACYVFTAIDDLGADDGGQFETSGIMSSQAKGYQPKPAYFSIQRMIEEMRVSQN